MGKRAAVRGSSRRSVNVVKVSMPQSSKMKVVEEPVRVRVRRRYDRLTRLTDREREALGLIAEGRPNRVIAEGLGITTKPSRG